MQIRTALLVAVLLGVPVPLNAQQVPSSESPSAVPADVPLPDRNPKRLEPPVPPHPREMEAPEWSAQEVQSGTDQCDMMLADIGVVYSALEPIREGICGTPAPIKLKSIGKDQKVSIEPPARVTCGLAASLSAWIDTVMQPMAKKHLNSEIVAIRNVASYVCRNRYNAPGKRISEHARANALDMAAFKTADGRWISVLDHWAATVEPPVPDAEPASVKPVPEEKPKNTVVTTAAEPKTVDAESQEIKKPPERAPESAFLHDIHDGACKLFGTVLGPLANKAHENHFHYDLAPRKRSNFCE